LQTDNSYIYGPNDSWTTVNTASQCTSNPYFLKVQCSRWLFPSWEPISYQKLSADHRNKWMSAYLLPFPTHAKSKHITFRK